MMRTRLCLMVNDKFYYDIGLRKGDRLLSKFVYRFSEKQPRFLEDFIEVFGKANVNIIGYGSLVKEKDYIDILIA